jgi:L-amino acid N-acyltransferase YncA
MVAAGPAGETNTVAAKHFGNGYYLYGPVVVDTAARAHGVLRKLSQAMFEGTKDSYSAAVAFIEDADHVSRVVHQRLGWKQVDEFKVGGSGYHVFWHATGGVA